MKKFIVVYTTFPDLKTAKKVINALITKKLAACGNIFKLSSIYIWQKKIEESGKYGVFIKTIEKNYPRVADYIKDNHPYEVPEIISWKIEKGLKEYLNWIEENCK